MDSTMWRIMIDPEIGFLIKTATSDQAKQIVAQRFKVNPKEIISCSPDKMDMTDKPDEPEKDWNKQEIASKFDKPKFNPGFKDDNKPEFKKKDW